MERNNMKRLYKFSLILWLGIGLGLTACSKEEQKDTPDPPKEEITAGQGAAYAPIRHPEWSKNANIYEVNLRQYTPGGSITEFETHLPRLKEMGVDILWFMPIQPIGVEKRKGNMGSYYSIRDYQAVSPEHGTLEEFKALVSKCHEMGFKVILDWVANHSSWDNVIMDQHPEWYTKDSAGNFQAPVPDWSDVADLNYEDSGLREYMINSMKFWVETCDIDGFRCDVAMMVPMDFWNDARQELDKIKPVFMLAEAEGPEFHAHAFDMTYGWELHHIMNQIAKGEKTATELENYLNKEANAYSSSAYRMHFTSNHDENSWNGTVKERMGKAGKVFAVLSATFPGMPLIYSGMEAGLDKRLEFFDKDEIDWSSLPLEEFYTQLLSLKHDNPALWNGEFGGTIKLLNSNVPEQVIAFVREKEESQVVVILNLSGKAQEAEIDGGELNGNFSDIFSGTMVEAGAIFAQNLEPWAYRVYQK